MDTVRKLVSRRLSSEPIDSHPDPELLAAFAERSISSRDRNSVLGHLSTCADCRDTLYLALPEASDMQQAFSPQKQPRFAWRWATLAASVVIIGGVVIGNRGVFTQKQVQHPEMVGYSTPVPESPSATTQPAARERTDAPTNETRARLRPPAKHMTAAPQAAMQFDQSGEVHFAAAPSANAAVSANALQKSTQLDQSASARDERQSAAKVAAPLAAMTPVWRISAGGVPQRSLDGAQTWQTASPEDGAQFHVVSSVGPDIWVGGSAGSLYHSSDTGQNWTKVEPTAGGQTLQSDVTQIRFSSAQSGVITTANGQVWTTYDGGKNWQLK